MSKIEFSNVTYKEREEVLLKNITLSIEKGELFMIKGSSKRDKRAFLMLAQQLLTPSDGVVTLGDKDPHIGSNIIPFISTLTVKEALAIPLLIRGFSEKEIAGKTEEISRYFSIDNDLETKVSLISAEKKAMLGVAKAVISEPSLVILDSFSEFLDHKLAVLVLTFLHEICVDFNVTVITVENDAKLHPFASKILHLENGYIKDLVGEGVDFQKLMPFLKI